MSRSATYSESSPLAYVRQVYAWLFVGVLITIGAAWGALNIGVPVTVTIDKQLVSVPPLVAAIVQHPMAAGLLFLALVVMAGISRKLKGLNAVAFLGTTAFSGVFIGPAVFAANLKASMGNTLSSHPVRDAGILTVLAFTGLTGYVFASKRDFSAWGSVLMTGLMVLIGAMFLSIFVGSNALSLAISSVAVLLFAGFIVFDTWRILNVSERDDAIGDALNMYLNVLNIFLSLIRIFGSSSSSKS